MARTGDSIYSGEKGSYQQARGVGDSYWRLQAEKKDQQEYPLKVNAPSEASLFSQTKGRIRMKINI